jgi:hypothetical protein
MVKARSGCGSTKSKKTPEKKTSTRRGGLIAKRVMSSTDEIEDNSKQVLIKLKKVLTN